MNLSTVLAKGKAKNQKNCKNFNVSPDDFHSEGKSPVQTIKFDNTIYAHPKIKQALLEAHNYKCCYCEKKLSPYQLDVEHYRPKTSVKQSRKGKDKYPGYYWLAYTWSNLYLSCSECNRTYKKTLFPLLNPAKRSGWHKDTNKIRDERPMFVNPNGKPEKHIQFNLSGQPDPLTEEGRITIEELGLRRKNLIGDRTRKLIALLSYRLILEAYDENSSDERSRVLAQTARKALDEAITPTAEFSAMARDILSRDFDTAELLKRLIE